MAADSASPESDRNLADAPLTPLERAAADWLIARDRGLSPERSAEFKAWLAEDPSHPAMFAQMEAAWETLDRLDELPRAAESAPVSAAQATPPRQRVFWFAGLALAAAAAIALIVAPRRSAPVPAAATYRLSAATEVGDARTLSLPDGSEIQLNTDSAVAVSFAAGERRIALTRGEAYFHVAKDAARPFLVTAGHVVVRAVGTQFDVRMQPTQVVVMVTEGKVRLSDAARGSTLLPGGAVDEPPVLAAGERAVVPVAPGGMPQSAFPTHFIADEQEQALAWKQGRLEFVDAPLATIVAEFNRYNRHKLVIGDAALATRRFGGTFATTDHDAFVRVLESEFGLTAQRGANETVLRVGQ